MTTPAAEKQSAESRLEQALHVGAGLGNWAMAVNFCGIVFVLMEQPDKTASSPLPLSVLYACFLVGLIAAFIGKTALLAALDHAAKGGTQRIVEHERRTIINEVARLLDRSNHQLAESTVVPPDQDVFAASRLSRMALIFSMICAASGYAFPLVVGCF